MGLTKALRKFCGALGKAVLMGVPITAAAMLTLTPVASQAAVFVSVTVAPPALPIYAQPICPGDGYLWTPGYWAWGDDGYYWVPGVWVRPPAVGMLWTPGYWGWSSGVYLFHAGYWGPHVGFYGGINYGFGFTGVGYEGGYWNRGVFAYNRAVNNVNVTNIHNVYNKTVIVNNNVTVNRVSYNGGNGGIQARPNLQEQAALREPHVAPTVEQQAHVQNAALDRSQLAKVNGGRPQNLAESRVGERAANQQGRIAQGVRSGQLTPGETRNLENRSASIQQQTRADRAANGGRLTPQERQNLNQRQNNVNRSIYNDKHNGNVDRSVQRENRQQPREGEKRPNRGM